MGQSDMSAGISNTISSLLDVLNTSIKRLSSGLRVQSACDDAAGLAVRELLRADVATARQGSRNISDGISMLQTADGAAQAISDNLIRMKELAAQAASVTLTPQQKEMIQNEFEQLVAENARVVQTTEYNGVKLFEDGQTISISFGNGDTVNIQTQAIADVTANLVDGAPDALETVDAAINQLAAMRGGFGASMSQMESVNQAMNQQTENVLAAESRISDVDVAREVVNLTAAEVQARVGIASQAQANLLGEVVLSLVE
jgi:flagellin